MIVLHIDLDNTLIYSWRHDIGKQKRAVERYQGREISFITERTYELLKTVRESMVVVPTSTRTIEQYNRVDLGTGAFPYALVCNGGILLRDGRREQEWYQSSLEQARESQEGLGRALEILEKDSRRCFELRFIEGLFIFTKCEEPEAVAGDLREKLDGLQVDVFRNGAKVYVVPKKLSKGNAVKRFKEYMGADLVLAAGDSAFDISMLLEADGGLAPCGFSEEFGLGPVFGEPGREELFSEYVLEECRRLAKEPGLQIKSGKTGKEDVEKTI